MRTPPPALTCGFLIQLVFCQKKKKMWFIGVEVEQETSAPPPKKKNLDLCNAAVTIIKHHYFSLIIAIMNLANNKKAHYFCFMLRLIDF